MQNTTNSVISLDYLYLGLANIKKKTTMGADVTAAEPVLLIKRIELIKRSELLWKVLL
jgi:hypothetical protein